MLNYVRQFFKIRVVSHALYLCGDPQFFCISDTSNSLSDCSKNLKRFYSLENFRATVLKRGSSTPNNLMGGIKTLWKPCVFQARPLTLFQRVADGHIWFFAGTGTKSVAMATTRKVSLFSLCIVNFPLLC